MSEKLQIIGPGNWDLYQKWIAAAIDDDTVRPYLQYVGWFCIEEKPLLSDWDKLMLCNGRTLITMGFERTGTTSISLAGWTLGPNKRLATGRAMVEAMGHMRRYSFLSHVTSMVLESNVESMALTKNLLGDPWGIKPEAGWDARLGKQVGIAHFSAPLAGLLKRFDRQ